MIYFGMIACACLYACLVAVLLYLVCILTHLGQGLAAGRPDVGRYPGRFEPKGGSLL